MAINHALLDKKNYFALNSFQKMMLKWNTLTPYNAGHVIHLSGIPDVAHWEKVTLVTIQELKLGIPQFIQHNQYVRFTPINLLPIETSTMDLDSYINIEMNRPFLTQDFPIRFFIVTQENRSYYFGAIYNHWIADSYAIRALFQRIFERYQTGESSLPPLSLDAPCFRSVFQKYLGKIPWLENINTFINNITYFQSVYRVKLDNLLNFHMGFNRYYLPDGLINNLYHYSKSHHASINDIFLAALAKTLGNHTHSDRSKQKRKKMRLFSRNRLVLGTIVDVRHHVQNELDYVFGQYLSNYTVQLKKPEETSFIPLLKNITKQTSKIKRKFKSIKNFASWDLALFAWNFLSTPKSQARFFYKNAPVIAGISNVDLTRSWIGQNKERKSNDILDYIRISPAGILLPLVFTLTTLQQRLSLCITYRTTAFSKEDIEALSRSFTDYLIELTTP